MSTGALDDRICVPGKPWRMMVSAGALNCPGPGLEATRVRLLSPTPLLMLSPEMVFPGPTSVKASPVALYAPAPELEVFERNTSDRSLKVTPCGELVAPLAPK